jgi:hypothetical protein
MCLGACEFLKLIFDGYFFGAGINGGGEKFSFD